MLSDLGAVGNVSELDNGWRMWNRDQFSGVWASGDGITVEYTLGMSRLSRWCSFTVDVPRPWFTVALHLACKLGRLFMVRDTVKYMPGWARMRHGGGPQRPRSDPHAVIRPLPMALRDPVGYQTFRGLKPEMVRKLSKVRPKFRPK